MTKAFQFGSFTLDLDRLCLFGPGGRAELRPKSFEVLRYLVEHEGRVVGKEELIKAVWLDVTVTDESLTRCISEVRRAIGDGSQQIIKTVPKRGYLVDVPISVTNIVAVPAPQPAIAPLDVVPSADHLSRHDIELIDSDVLAGERKPVTVLHADIKESLELVAARDPEQALKIFDAVLKLMTQAVHQYGGTVSLVTGEGSSRCSVHPWHTRIMPSAPVTRHSGFGRWRSDMRKGRDAWQRFPSWFAPA
jgi:DNA-binding winged helix-turn-helix (wHTH) protein